MTRVHLMVEGQTEETFVRDVLYDHFALNGAFLNPFLSSTSPGHKGGVTGYGKIQRQVKRKCREDQGAYVTTMIDLYALPNDFPNYAETLALNLDDRVRGLEQALSDDIGEPNFIPNLIVHEFEGLLFTDVSTFGSYFDDQRAIENLRLDTAGFTTPEHINDNPRTAPSKRILAVLDDYQKPLDGPRIARDIGLDRIRDACPHFKAWLERLGALANPAGGRT